VTTAATRPVDAATLLVAAGFEPIAAVSFVFWIPLALGASLLLDGRRRTSVTERPPTVSVGLAVRNAC
jgi:hypothetical protein